MLRILSLWLSPHARQARIAEVFGDLLEACEHYLHAGLKADAARVLEQLADREELPPETRLHHYQQAHELLGATRAEQRTRLAAKMLPLLAGAPVGSPAFRRRCELLGALGMKQELGAELERDGQFAAAMEVYTQAGLLEEIDRLAEAEARILAGRQRLTEQLEALEAARAGRDRLTELRLLRSIAAEPESAQRAPRALEDLRGLEAALPGPRVCLESEALPLPVQVHAAASLLLGRDADADLRIAAPGVSRRHARLFAHGGRLFVEDLESRNGTYLDGLRVEGYVEVCGLVRLGLGTELELSLSRLASPDGTGPSALLEGRALPRPVLLLSGAVQLGTQGPLRLRHPALKDGALRLVSSEDLVLIAPAPDGPEVLLAGRPLGSAQPPLAGEPVSVGMVPFVLRRLDPAAPAAWNAGAGPWP
jgi:tetratricopeptide (TPR) repeat protein